MNKKTIFVALVLINLTKAENKNTDEIHFATEEQCNPELNGTDCPTHPFELCDAESKLCVHKELFPPEPTEILGYIFLPLLFAIAAVGGVGGGIILIPLMIGFFQF